MSSITRWKRGLADEGDQLGKLGYEDTIAAQKRSFFQFFGIDVDSNYFQGKDVLEVGCSPFALIHGIPNHCTKVGIDPCASSEKFKIHYRDKTAVSHITGMAENLPFKDNSFDVIICINALDHWLEPSLGLKEIRRVLRKGGLFLVVTHTFSLPKNTLGLLSHLDQHPLHFTHNKVLSLVKDCGFDINFSKNQRISFLTVLTLLKKRLIKSSLKTFVAIMLRINDSAYCLTKK